MNAVATLGTSVGARDACSALNVHRSRYYRFRRPKLATRRAPQPLKLSADERQHIHELLNSPPFVDQAPAAVVASLLDEGQYLCSARTMYRLLHDHQQVRERRRGHRRAHYAKPELVARAPNQCWSWDITKLKGPRTWQYFYRYVILDIYSRYVVGWMVAERESAVLAKQLITQTCAKQGIVEGQLTLHADRGASMKSKLVAQLLVDLGVIKSHSRPHISDDNPFSEAQFKTLKYRPEFPVNFPHLGSAEKHNQSFFNWYNLEHKHSGIAMLTPHDVYYGLAGGILAERQLALNRAFTAHPERFKYTAPTVTPLPTAVWINPPTLQLDDECRPSN
jgi:putative transposase